MRGRVFPVEMPQGVADGVLTDVVEILASLPPMWQDMSIMIEKNHRPKHLIVLEAGSAGHERYEAYK